MVYTAAAGVPPEQVLPVQVDVGCNTAEVRDNPFYMGLQQVGGLTPASKPTTTKCGITTMLCLLSYQESFNMQLVSYMCPVSSKVTGCVLPLC